MPVYPQTRRLSESRPDAAFIFRCFGQSLPPSRRWSAKQRARFLTVVTMMVDWLVEVVPEQDERPQLPQGGEG